MLRSTAGSVKMENEPGLSVTVLSKRTTLFSGGRREETSTLVNSRMSWGSIPVSRVP